MDLQYRPLGRIHGRFPELFRVHFAKPFVTLDIRIVLTAHLVKFLLQFIVTVSIRVVLARTNEIKGRLGNKNIAISDEGLHVSVEERQEQRPDVGPIDISIGHDDDLAVTDFTEIEFIANPAAKGRDHGADFIVVQHLVQAGLLHVEDFAAQGQDGLEGTVTALFGAAASGVPFDDVDFRFFRILTGTVRQFPRQGAYFQRALAPCQITDLAGSRSGTA